LSERSGAVRNFFEKTKNKIKNILKIKKPMMPNLINKNLLKTTFIFLILAEILSFFGWMLPEFNLICFFVILFLALILSLKKLEYGIYILFAELFIGSKGYLFSLGISDVVISVRIGLFLVVFSVWFYRFLFCHSDRQLGSLGAEESLKCGITHLRDLSALKVLKVARDDKKKGLEKYFFALAIIILWALIWGIIQGNNFGNVFFDFNNWLYFLLIFPVYCVAKNNDKFLKNILSILIACVVWIGIKSLILLYIFSHEFIWALPEVYKWVRDTGIGEVTRASGNFYRIFIQSQIYSLFLFFILLPISNFQFPISKQISNSKLKIKKNIIYYLLLIICLIIILISFSRSYWVALIIALLIYFFIILFKKIKFLDFLKINAKIALVAIASFILVFSVINLPPKTGTGDLSSLLSKRATEIEAAASSRMNQLKPLLQEIAKHPIIGSGFGTTVTYKSDDPRILGNYTSYAFEWGYLDMILKFGVLGMAVYLILIVGILKRLLISNFQFPISNKIINSMNLGFALALIALLIVNIFSPYLNHPLGIGFIIILSVL